MPDPKAPSQNGGPPKPGQGQPGQTKPDQERPGEMSRKDADSPSAIPINPPRNDGS